MQQQRITLPSGEQRLTSRAQAVHSLKQLLDWYGEREKEYHHKTYHGEGLFSDGMEREWMRYRDEAAGLQFAITALEALDHG